MRSLTDTSVLTADQAVHCSLVVVDVEGFGGRSRTMPHQVAVRAGMYRALRGALSSAGIAWTDCYHEDRGDGVVVLVPARTAKALLVERLPLELVNAIREHNRVSVAPQRIRMRMAVHAGEVVFDRHGVTATSLNFTFRLIEAPTVKKALAESPGVLALITSDWFFEEVVRHSPDASAASYRPVRVSVKETSTVGWLSLPDHPYPADESVLDAPMAPQTPVPRQLPAKPRWFAGRSHELALLTKEVRRASYADPTQVTTVVHGAGGIGKTWLAVQWCHQHLDQFPDGQLFVDLRGFSPTEEQMTAAGAVRCFLDALGVSPQAMPVAFEAQVGLYRSLVAGRRMVIVMDNVRNTAQVAQLLPGTPACVVIVTSRNRLDGLVTGHGANLLALDTLAGREDRALLTARLGRQRLAVEPAATAELLAQCGGFPLALSIVAARAAAHPEFPLAGFAAELRDITTRLGVLDDNDPASSLLAVLSWSCRALTDAQIETFQLLGIAPGQDIGLAAAASLLGVPAAHTAAALRALEQVSLIQQHAPGRWRMHDLIRLYAANQEHHLDRREAARRRVVDFFVHTACLADRVLFPSGPSFPLDEPVPGCRPDPPHDRADAMAWFAKEHECLLAAQQVAVDREWHSAVWQLAWSMHTFHWWQGHFRDHVTVWRAGLAAADLLGDPVVQATANLMFGDALARIGRPGDALTHLEQGQAFAVQANDAAGQARAHYVLGWAWEQRADFHKALDHACHSLRLFRDSGTPVWTALALNAVGWFHAQLNEYEAARSHCDQALLLFRAHNDRNGEAATLDSLGYIAHCTGKLSEAATHYSTALQLYRELDNAYCAASTLDHLAETHLAAGATDLATTTWQQAYDLYEAQNRTTECDRVSRHLGTTGGARIGSGTGGRAGR